MSTNLLTASLVGISLWATIEPPKPIVKLNVKNERPLLALKLAVNYSQGIYTVGLEMPETFSVSVIINQGSLYISSGVRIGGKSYPRGISASASVTVFDKPGQFDALSDDSGFTGKGSIDRFKLGALEVSAVSDVTKPATFDIAMAQDEQKIKIDGMIHYHYIKLLSLVDADLQKLPPMFNAHLLLESTEQYKIDFFVKASLGSVKSLSEVALEFSALIQGDLFDLICDGVNLFLDRMQKLENGLSEKNKELELLQEDLKRRDQDMKDHEKKRQRDLEEARRKVKENKDKLAALEKDVQDAKENKEEAEKRYKKEVKGQQEERDRIVAEKRRECDEKLRKLEKDEQKYRTEKENLEATHRTNYGEKETVLEWFKQHKHDTWGE